MGSYTTRTKSYRLRLSVQTRPHGLWTLSLACVVSTAQNKVIQSARFLDLKKKHKNEIARYRGWISRASVQTISIMQIKRCSISVGLIIYVGCNLKRQQAKGRIRFETCVRLRVFWRMSSRPLPKTGEENLHFFPGNSHVFQEQQGTLWKPCNATEKDFSKLMSFAPKTKILIRSREIC